METSDDRPRLGAPQLLDATGAVRWSVTYERVELPADPQRHTADVVEGSVTLGAGTF